MGTMKYRYRSRGLVPRPVSALKGGLVPRHVSALKRGLVPRPVSIGSEGGLVPRPVLTLKGGLIPRPVSALGVLHHRQSKKGSAYSSHRTVHGMCALGTRLGSGGLD